MLVYAEPHSTIEGAIRREKEVKNWTRARKIRLIEAANPEWRDLYEEILR
jgi:putative endonuclease